VITLSLITQHTNSGTVLACGNSDCGQVGLGEEEEEKNVALLTPLPTLAGKRITYVACGGISSVVCTADGRVFSWGCNDDGALGRASATDTGKSCLLICILLAALFV
jgi:regulator of chromosome condensation